MGTKVQYKSYLQGCHPMGDLNDDSNSGTWPVFQPSSNGQFHNSYSQKTIADAYFGDHTEAVKHKILEHEAIFKTQLYELHRLYQVQRELMDELKMNELHKQSLAIETSMSSCSASHRQDAPRWNTSSAFPAVVGATDFKSTPSFLASPQNGLKSSSNAVGSKDCEIEILECRCRPSKVRRKSDLELRADEYIDLEEPNFNPKRTPGVSCYTTNGSCNDQPSSGSKLFLGRSIKIDSRGDGARLKNGENGSAELHKQTHSQGKNSSLDYVGCDSNVRPNQQFCSIQALPLDFMHHGRDDSRSRNLTIAHKENGRMWPHMLDSGRSKGQTTAFSQNTTSEKISLFNKQQDATYFQSGHIKADYLKERFEGGPKPSRNGTNGLGSVHQSKKSFSASAPWEVSGSCITQKSATLEMHPCFISSASFPQSMQSSSTSIWQNNLDDGKGSCSGSGPARCPPVGSDYYTTSGLTFLQNGSMSIKGLDNVEARSSKGIDLNVISIGDSHDSVDRPCRGNVAALPWMKSSAGLKNGEIQSFKCSVARQVTGPGLEAKSGADHILRVPIFRECRVSKGASSRRSPLEEMEKSGNVRGFDMNLPCVSEENDAETPVISGRNHIDLNVCLTDYDPVMTTSTISEKAIKDFDLEAPGETEEDLFELKHQRPEHLDEELATVAAEAIFTIRKLALADTPARHPPVDSTVALKWFVDVISSNADDAEKVGQEVTTEEADSMDYFEYMTLQLPETKEDDHLPDYPKPTELDEQTEAGPCTTRPRKGQARRCRAKRDFQRDILPGLTSLARHEVTEDLQTLGGLMRAMGHSWQSGLTRRAGPRRGRPRLTPLPPPSQPKKHIIDSISVTSPTSTPSPQKRTTTNSREPVETEDQRSLAGWGKTTRRPRRQRCLTGNSNNNSSALRIA